MRMSDITYYDYRDNIYRNYPTLLRDKDYFSVKKSRENLKLNPLDPDINEFRFIQETLVPAYNGFMHDYNVYNRFKRYTKKYIESLSFKLCRSETGFITANLSTINTILMTSIHEFMLSNKGFINKLLRECNGYLGKMGKYKFNYNFIQNDAFITKYKGYFRFFIIHYLERMFIEDIIHSNEKEYRELKIDIHHYFTFLSNMKCSNLNVLKKLKKQIDEIELNKFGFTKEFELYKEDPKLGRLNDLIKATEDVMSMIGNKNVMQYDPIMPPLQLLKIRELTRTLISGESEDTKRDIISLVDRYDELERWVNSEISLKEEQLRLCYGFDLKTYYEEYIFVENFESLTYFINNVMDWEVK